MLCSFFASISLSRKWYKIFFLMTLCKFLKNFFRKLIFIMIETLRQTPLKVFIPGLARSLSAVTASALFAFGVFVSTYLLGWDRTKDIDQYDSRWVKIANETGQKCLINSTVDIWLVSMTTFGNVVVLFFCSFWETVPFVRYVWYRYNCSLPKVQKYLEILAFKERT